MLATAIIVFREVLEAALVVGIVMAASRGVPRRALWVGGGVSAGVIGACIVAAFAETIAAAASGIGQELFNAAVLFLAVLMLGWHNIWMGKHGRELARDAHALGRAVGSGARPLYALAIVVGMAVLREGSELVLFLYGVAASAGGGVNMVGGGVLGVAVGVATGAVLYFGLLRIPMNHLFAATSFLILLLAAGMASQAAAFLAQADLLPSLGQQIWDTSALVSDDSIVGKAMHALIGYVAQPAGIQLVFWAATFLVIGGLMRLNANPPSAKDLARGGAALALILLLSLALAAVAHADFQVRSPIVETGELEFEHNGDVTHDRNSTKNNGQSYTNAVGYGVNDFWQTELEGEWNAAPGANLRYDATTWENKIQLTPQGKYWADFGFFAEYSHSADRNTADSVQFGPILQIEQGDALHTLNLFLAKDIGHASSGVYAFNYAAQSRFRLDPLFEPGAEIYGTLDDVTRPGNFRDQDHRAGPVAVGRLPFFEPAEFKYEIGYLVGLTQAAPAGTVRWKLELGTHF